MTLKKLLLVTAMVLTGSLSAAQAATSEINVAYVKSPFNLQNIVMKKNQLLEKEFQKDGIKINWVSINSGAQQAQAMAAGSLDVSAVMNTASLLMANGAGNKIYIADENRRFKGKKSSGAKRNSVTSNLGGCPEFKRHEYQRC